ncbi:efflux transporter outer membrane subunit [Uliginosibacterium paludis]|uniref:Efflux transporter outer membrane subunit n=1 Tax=Uliginosibacterium paludis TaxID=1615952 RepID=A0ABV2CKV7_9RHOO
MSMSSAPSSRRALCALLAAALTLSGCSSLIRTPYTAPRLESPASWLHADKTGSTTPASLQRWWEAFADPALNAHMEEALRSNADLAAAAITLRRARLQAGLADSDLWPTASASVGQKLSRPMRGEKSISRSYSASAGLSWQLDLWGKLASARDASQWEASATEEDRNATALSLSGSVATFYWQLGLLNEEVALSRQNLEYSEKTLDLTRRKFAAGAVSRLDVLSAEQSIASQRSSLANLIQQQEEARTSFALLFGGAPQRRFDEPATLPRSNLPEVEPGLPASLLAARPDLKAAELRLRSTLASGDATRASYYPDLSLTGSLGSSSDRLRSVLNNPVAALATELSLPFLNAREMRLSKQVAQADYDLAVVNFRKTFYTALGDVENALSARRQYQEQAAELERSLAAAEEIERINDARYRAGAIPLQTLLDAQQTRRSAQTSLIQTRYNLLASQATLNLALGGNFSAQ